MKTLYLMRHAKSSRKDDTLEDKQRPLSKRGKRDVQYMSRLLAPFSLPLDIVYHSGAKRSYDTASCLKKSFHKTTQLLEAEVLYEATQASLYEFLRMSNDAYTSMGLVGHNPSLSGLFELFTGVPLLLKTSEVVALSFEVGTWKEIAEGRCCLLLSPHMQYIQEQ